MQPTAMLVTEGLSLLVYILSVAACAAVPELNSHDGQNGPQNLK